ncbi:MAG: DNA polymerase II large subunit [Nanoarchaeota archaeon]
MNTEEYFAELRNKVEEEFRIAGEARKKNLDPVGKVEIPLASSLAEKVVGLISTIYPQLDQNVVKRILELEKEYGPLDIAVSFKIAEEIAKEKFCKFESFLQAIDAGIRVGFAYNTLGVVSSPIEGFTELRLGKTKNNEDYFIAYFSGPIRSAGTTASCVVLMLIDYLRELFGYARYDPTEEEVKRYITENYDYHERVSNLQYLPTEEEIGFLAKNLPIQIAGEPTENKEVSNYKDLKRVETNFIRGGMCLIFSEGLAQKAQKGFRLLKGLKEKGFKTCGWDFLEDYITLHKKREKGTADASPTYIKDLVAGRPVFGHPSHSGGFRFRYGRSRVAGFSATSVHPATMGISNCFLSTGTQLKIEKPTKGCAITSCDKIDGPIVKLTNGSVKKINDFDEAKKIYKDVEEIIYLGDILFPLGDVINRNYELLKPGYVEEWWGLELLKKAEEKNEKLILDFFEISLDDAIEFSKRYEIPLHPSYIFYWTQITKEQFIWLLDWLQNGVIRENGKVVLPFEKFTKEKFLSGKRALELIGIEHDVIFDNVVIKKGKALLLNLGIDSDKLKDGENLKEYVSNIIEISKNKETVLDIINSISSLVIKDKAGDFIGTRMGRPEKAKLRKLTGSPNVLFPIGEQGGRFRSVNEAVNAGFIKADFPNYFCRNCGAETIYKTCEKCRGESEKRFFCLECKSIKDKKCPEHDRNICYSNKKIDSKYYFDNAIKSLSMKKEEVPVLIKGVKGTSSDEHDFEHLEKGIIRSKFNLCVNKDGTIRYDATELPITHFKPKEIGTNVEKLKDMGYDKDVYGNDFVNEDQILILKPHDIILPACPETKDEKADDVFLNISKFLDELLERFYKLPKYYNLKSRDDLIGQLVACMAPHNCAGVIGRIVGFSKVQGLLATPYMHAAMRRDCDGDEAAVMMLLDVLINFSRKFLPAHRGGTQDAPLVLNARINAGEVDDQILDFELCGLYPLDLYQKAEQRKHSSEIQIDTVKKRLKEKKDPFIDVGFTHDSSNFNCGVINSSYKSLPTMKDKVGNQMDLVSKLRAVDSADVARLVIERHFIRDIRGNLRKFSMQQFRCVSCNEKYRRPPLTGNCLKCNGKIIFTISEGSIVKYMEPALELANNFGIPEYTKQCLELAKVYIESIFGKAQDKQVDLKQWF